MFFKHREGQCVYLLIGMGWGDVGCGVPGNNMLKDRPLGRRDRVMPPAQTYFSCSEHAEVATCIQVMDF